MILKIIYFAAAREAAKVPSEKMTLPEGTRIDQVADEIIRLHPSAASVVKSSRFSVNLEFVAGEWTPRDGDEIGVLPPVAGG